jgi:hypothetical protein
MQRHFDGRPDGALVERFGEITIRARCRSTRDGSLVGEGRKKNHRQRVTRANALCGLDPIDVVLELNVHQDQVRSQLLRFADRFAAGPCDTHDFVTQPFQRVAQIFADDHFIFDNQDSVFWHETQA